MVNFDYILEQKSIVQLYINLQIIGPLGFWLVFEASTALFGDCNLWSLLQLVLDSHRWVPLPAVGYPSNSVGEDSQEDVTPPSYLMEHPPLAVFVNGKFNFYSPLIQITVVNLLFSTKFSISDQFLPPQRPSLFVVNFDHKWFIGSFVQLSGLEFMFKSHINLYVVAGLT